LQVHLGDTPKELSDQDYINLGLKTEGFSGSDVSVVVKDVLMQPIRTLKAATHFRTVRTVSSNHVAFAEVVRIRALMHCGLY
jgi:SpoVK/Ycf46/Vps4 family AAA+-type ATPase